MTHRRSARPDDVPTYIRAVELAGAALLIDMAAEELERVDAHALMNTAYGLRNEILSEYRRLMVEARATGEVRPCPDCSGAGRRDGRPCHACTGLGLVTKDGLRLPRPRG